MVMVGACIFCKIIKKEIPSTVMYENEFVLVVNDISPKAPIHYLIFPKKHIVDISHVVAEDWCCIVETLKMASELGKKLLPPSAFNLISNNGAAAGQSVFHMHWHFLAGKNIYEGGFSL
jgi:diadenosine tetraphosphate (Ap4A) HIT family hydrolase